MRTDNHPGPDTRHSAVGQRLLVGTPGHVDQVLRRGDGTGRPAQRRLRGPQPSCRCCLLRGPLLHTELEAQDLAPPSVIGRLGWAS
jgi:hypothetical protein